MKASSIAPPIVLSLTVVAAIGCSASAKTKAAALQKVVEASLEAKLEVLNKEENLERIERIADAVLKAEATRELARKLAEGAVLGLSEAARKEELRVAASGFVDALSAALSDAGGGGLDGDLSALLRDAGAAAAQGVLDDSVRERADPFARDLSRTVAAALLEQTAAELPAILDVSFQRLSPRLGETIGRDVAPALAASITSDLAPALAAGLEQSLGPALEALLENRLLAVLDRAASDRLPPLVRHSTREAMLGLGEALDGELGEQARAFVYSLIDGSKQRLGAKLGTSSWVLGAAAAGLLAAVLACAYFWRHAREHRRLHRARESALFLLTNTINRLPDDLQRPVKSAVAEAGRIRDGERRGGAELQLFLDHYNL